MLRSHGRFPYSAITNRPSFTWPEERRLAIHVSLNLEHFAYGEGLGISYSPGLPHPNTYNWGWREYGNRVGVWRLLELFDEFKLPVSLLLNSEVYDHCAEVVAAFRARGDEVVGHGRTNSEHQNDFDEAGEKKLIDDVTSAIKRHEGKPPAGWLSPGVNPSNVTSDQPVWIRTRKGRLLSVPYPQEVNDIPMIALHHGTAEAFADVIVANFDEMQRQSRRQSLVYGIALHAFIMGQPFRIQALRRAFEHLRKADEGTWFATTGAIADHFIATVPSN